MKDYLLGIDTGGTYTDGVLLDLASREVVETTKTPTTHHDLSLGILAALQDLLPTDPGSVRLVAISTTLATNAIAEGKGRPVALLLLGYDPELIGRFQFASHFGTPHFRFLDGGHDLHGQPQTALDEKGLANAVNELKGQVDAFAISGYFSPFNANHENRAFELIQGISKLPVVLGSQLSRQLNSIQRATTATLNASLLGILQDFIGAMQSSLAEWKLQSPLMVVRGDGALMAQNVAKAKPVETVHSGPAASAIGGRFLAGVDQAVVIDVGGTTTDIALIENGRVRIEATGTTVGEYATAVRAANIRSIGLGGDSWIRFDVEDHLVIGPDRVIPIARLAHDHPTVAAELSRLRWPEPDHLEYWLLSRQPERSISEPRALEVLDRLSAGPRSLPSLLDQMGLLHPIQFQANRLLREGIIARAALTPTDLFHISGEFTPWHRGAAETGAWAMAASQGLEVEQFASAVRQRLARRIAAELISFISGTPLEYPAYGLTEDELGRWLFHENLTPDDPFLGSKIFLKVPLIGIGAPAPLLLPSVAELLHTELIIPPHYAVANAVGAVAASVTASQEAWIYPQMRGRHVGGYFVQAAGGRQRFATLDKARQFAKEQCRQQVLAEAEDSGVADPQVSYQWIEQGAESHRLLVQASGSPSLG